MYLLVLLLLLDILYSTNSLSISVFPSAEVWEGGNITMECQAEGEVGVIWVREQFSEDENVGEKDLLAHDEQILIDDERVKVEKGIKQNHTFSRIRVSCKNTVFKKNI